MDKRFYSLNSNLFMCSITVNKSYSIRNEIVNDNNLDNEKRTQSILNKSVLLKISSYNNDNMHLIWNIL